MFTDWNKIPPNSNGKIMHLRTAYILGFIITTCLLLTTFYLEFFQGFVPCPLCILQRFVMGLLSVLFLLGIFLARKYWSRIFITVLLSLSSLLGVVLAGRQVWIQTF